MEKEFLVKVHETYRDVVSVCDKELIGKLIIGGGFQLDLTSTFYEGDEMSRKELVKVIQAGSNEDATFNVVGNKSVQVFLDLGLIVEEGIRKIDGISYALVLV